jgi:hypothetical protein
MGENRWGKNRATRVSWGGTSSPPPPVPSLPAVDPSLPVVAVIAFVVRSPPSPRRSPSLGPLLVPSDAIRHEHPEDGLQKRSAPCSNS